MPKCKVSYHKAIVTKYCGPTEYHPARILVSDSDHKMYVSANSPEMMKLDRIEDMHEKAAEIFGDKYNYQGWFTGGWCGNKMVFVLVEK